MFDILAIDWGTIRSGLAFGSSSTFLVLTYSKKLLTTDLFMVIEKEIKDRKPTIFLIGVPSNFKGQRTSTSVKIEEFCQILAHKYPHITLVTQNENGTSKLSRAKTLGNSKKNLQNTKHQINHLSAKALCEAYLDRHR